MSAPRSRDLRRAVLDASLSLIAEEGVGGLSLREVSRRAGVTHGAPYHHFADRGAILAALAEEGFVLLTRAMRDAIAAAPDRADARFRACGQAYVRFALGHTAHFRVMFRPELADPAIHRGVDAASVAALQVLIECVAGLQAAGMAPPGDPRAAVLLGWSSAHGLASLWVDGPLARAAPLWGHDAESVIATVSETLTALFVRAGAGRRTVSSRRRR